MVPSGRWVPNDGNLIETSSLHAMDHPPIFPPGLHAVGDADLDNHFLRAFSGSKTRPILVEGLRRFITALRRAGIPFEVWLDGSFCTKKLDPNDIDLVVFADATAVNSLDSRVQDYLRGLLDRTNARRQFGCDVLFAPAGNANLRSYWRGWYGFDRDERPKGIAKLEVVP